MNILRQSTAGQVISFGPFVSPSDGVTLVTSLVSAIDHATTGIMLSKNGGSYAVRHATVTASTYDAYGDYKVTLDATDTNTIGRLRVSFAAAASCAPVWRDFFVLSAPVYDHLVNTLVGLDGAIAYGTLAGISATTVTLPSGHGLAALGSAGIAYTSGTDAAGKSRTIAYSGSGDVFTVDPANNVAGESTPSGTVTFRGYPVPPAPTSTVPAVNVTQFNGSSYVEGSTLTPIKWLRLMGASLFGKASGMGTATAVLRDTTDTTNRITATVDADGNRTAVTLDAS